MDYASILRRAWHNVWNYRALWIFGVIVALTTFSFDASVFYSLGKDDEVSSKGIEIIVQDGETTFEALQRTIREGMDDFRAEIGEIDQELDEFFVKELHIEIESDIITFLIVLAAILFITYIIAKIAGYVSDTSLIRMVDHTEDSGVQKSVLQGLRMGWSGAAWRIFLIDLLVTLCAVFVGLLLLALLLAPLFLWTTGNTVAGVIGTITTVSLFFLA